MRKIFLIILLIATGFSFSAKSQTSGAFVTTVPANFTAVDQVKIIVDVSNVPNLVNREPLYVWTWNPNDAPPGNGQWENSNEARKMVKEAPNKWSWTITPATYYNVTPATVTKIQFLVKAKDGTGDRKTDDLSLDVAPLIFTPTVFRTFPAVAGQNEFLKVYLDQKLATDVTTERMNPTSAEVTIYNAGGIQIGGTVTKTVQALGNKVHSFATLPKADFVIPPGTVITKMRVIYKGTILDPTGATVSATSQPFEKLFDDLK